MAGGASGGLTLRCSGDSVLPESRHHYFQESSEGELTGSGTFFVFLRGAGELFTLPARRDSVSTEPSLSSRQLGPLQAPSPGTTRLRELRRGVLSDRERYLLRRRVVRLCERAPVARAQRRRRRRAARLGGGSAAARRRELSTLTASLQIRGRAAAGAAARCRCGRRPCFFRFCCTNRVGLIGRSIPTLVTGTVNFCQAESFSCPNF